MIYATPISGVEFELEPFWELEVATRPRPQPRPRHHKGGVFSNSKLVRAFKDDIAAAIRRLNGAPPPAANIPIQMDLEIGMPVKDTRKHGQLHTGKPDADNLPKAVKDVVVDAGVLHDDSQICAFEMVKAYAPHLGYVRIRLAQLR